MQRYCPICKTVKEITELDNLQYVQEQASKGQPLKKVHFRCESSHSLTYELKEE